MLNDGGEIIVLQFPSEHHAGTLGSCNDPRRIARPARCDFDREIDTSDALDLTDRETVTSECARRNRSRSPTVASDQFELQTALSDGDAGFPTVTSIEENLAQVR